MAGQAYTYMLLIILLINQSCWSQIILSESNVLRDTCLSSMYDTKGGVTSLIKCVALCLYDADCASVTYTKETHTCSMFSVCVRLDDCHGAVSVIGINKPAYTPGFFNELTGVCYRFIETTLSWTDSRTACEAENGQLAVLDSDEKTEWIKAARQSAGSGYVLNSDFWIGLYDSSQFHTWQWVDGQELENGKDNDAWYENSRVQEPNHADGGGPWCGEIFYEHKGLEWNDQICSAERFYVCEYTP